MRLDWSIYHVVLSLFLSLPPRDLSGLMRRTGMLGLEAWLKDGNSEIALMILLVTST